MREERQEKQAYRYSKEVVWYYIKLVGDASVLFKDVLRM